MAAGDATWNPKKNVAYRVTFPILDADGDLVSGATGLDSEVSKDGGTFTDCTNEATEIATSSGVYYLDLTATEMNADTVAVIVKTSSSGAKTTVLVFYPLETTDTPVDVLAISGDTVAADNLEAAADGTGYNLGGGSIVAASVTAAVTANTTQWGGVAVTGMPMPSYTQPTGFLAATFPTTVASTTNITGGTITTVTNVTNGVTVSTNNDKTGYSLSTAPPTAAAISDAVWDESIGDHLAAGSTGAALNAAGSAGDPWTTTLPGAYTGSQAGKILSDILVDTGTTLQGELDGIQADTEDIQSRLPAALVSGRMDSSVGAMAANVLTASALATDAATEIAAAVRTDLTTELGRLDASVSSRMATFTLPTHFTSLDIAANGHVSADVKAVSNNAITASSIQGGSITAAKFAAGAIDANALATDATTEIATAVYTGQMTESYRAAGIAPTLAQAMFELIAQMGDASISGTTKALRKLDGTTAKTFTLDSSTTPTSITEAT